MNFCLLFRDSKTSLDVSVYSSIKQVNEKEWNSIAKAQNVYQSIAYLSALEETLKEQILFRYLVFYSKEIPVAIAITQTLSFEDRGRKDQDQICEVRNKIKNHLVKSFDIRVLTCGTPFASGENGFAFSNAISPEEAYENLSKALIQLQKDEKDSLKAPIILIKEFWPSSFESSNYILTQDFRDFQIDVNMVMAIPSEWSIFEDYLFALNTKFRTKAKSAFKKSDDLVIRDLELDEIINYKDQIETLYHSVMLKADFNFGELNGDTFVQLKRNLGANFIIKGYFLENNLVGFSSAFVCGKVIDANYVGIDYDYNQQYAIYQRMLYDYVDLAITHKARELRFGRTAEEIKSTVGAEPVAMNLYIRHRNSLTNKLLKPIFASIKPSEFELRKPFKAVIYENA